MLFRSENAARSLLQEYPTSSDQQLIVHAFRRITGTDPTTDEEIAMQQFLEITRCELTANGAENSRLKALGHLCHAVFGSSRFQYLD